MLKTQHSGRLCPHHHTSFAALVFLIMTAIVLVAGMSWSVMAAEPAANPQSGSVGLTGVVRGPAPSTAAAILAPAAGSQTSTIPITVSGTCPANMFVTVTRNNVFGGVAACQDDGTFSMLIDLFSGTNTLVARVSDMLGQFGPDSRSVTVTYNAPSLGIPGSEIGRQLFLNMNTTVVGGDPETQISRSVIIVGGVGPYAVNWEWGDGTNSLMSVAGEGPVSNAHAYGRAGTYRVVVHVTDKYGNNAYLQFVTVVNGPATAVGATNGNGLGALPGELVAVWPVLLLALILVIAFWLGERREVAKLRHQGLYLVDRG